MTPNRAVRRRVALPVSQATSRKRREGDVRYASPQHKTLPHVVKFSGGRSSGMLLFTLLKKGMLKARRGDVVIFNNTSAEHPATYEFVRQCKKVCEGEYGVPFFWTEFQTYEDAIGGVYARLPAYRLVNDQPHSADNPGGYHERGEVFEELVSWTGFLPNMFSGRICTSWMKLFVSREFLSDWFARKDGISRLGHFGEASRIKPESAHLAHLRNGGRTPKDIFVGKKAYCYSRPLCRPAARFADFSTIADSQHIVSPELDGKSMGGRVRFSGDCGVDYCAFVGFRSDEPNRLAKMRARLGAEGNNANDENGENGENDSAEFYLSAPEGEHVYAPLVQLGYGKDAVAKFWQAQDWRLELPDDANLSNCVYCFMKGGLRQIASRQNAINRKLPAGLRGKKNTPSDIGWWIAFEKKYGRDLVAEKRKISNQKLLADGEKPVLGFFGPMHKMSYGKIAEMSAALRSQKRRGKRRNIYISEFHNLPCDCTD